VRGPAFAGPFFLPGASFRDVRRSVADDDDAIAGSGGRPAWGAGWRLSRAVRGAAREAERRVRRSVRGDGLPVWRSLHLERALPAPLRGAADAQLRSLTRAR